MGCLNPDPSSTTRKWFGNIHFSGPCNRRCYFCVGQHMMGLDGYDNLGLWPLHGMGTFLSQCLDHGVTDVNLTGSNTDPLLYRPMPELITHLRESLPGMEVGLRTNGALWKSPHWSLFDKGSISLPSMDAEIYRAMMGFGEVPNLGRILNVTANWKRPPKINLVLGPENATDALRTVERLAEYPLDTVNIREPYGQPHVGNPFGDRTPDGYLLGMPWYQVRGIRVTYWDVHYVEVESVNLYASGRVSLDYSVTKGHAPEGEVHPQSEFTRSGRIREQWVRAAE